MAETSAASVGDDFGVMLRGGGKNQHACAFFREVDALRQKLLHRHDMRPCAQPAFRHNAKPDHRQRQQHRCQDESDELDELTRISNALRLAA
jgi:hypothetical protein